MRFRKSKHDREMKKDIADLKLKLDQLDHSMAVLKFKMYDEAFRLELERQKKGSHAWLS